MTKIYRTIRHDETHWDLEQFFRTDEFIGWAVIKCNMEDDMKKCNLPTTRECFTCPCLGCDPTDESMDEYRNRKEQEQQAAEAREIAEWLDSMTPEPFVAWVADVENTMQDAADLQATQDNARL